MKAIIKNTSTEEDEKTGLSYFLYTHEHDNTGYYKIENLPLYDEKSHEAVDLDRVEEFINHNKRDFIKYSQSSLRRKDCEYYRYLENRGIYRNEWINLKTINKSEGGSGNYFIGASDNKSIFDKVIIPAISENLNNYRNDEGNSLIEMFKSNLSITQDLPVLIKRETSYRELLGEIKPLIENATSGAGFLEIKNRVIDEGNDLYFILNEEKNAIGAEIEKWDAEGKKANIEKENLAFGRENLYYNQEEGALDKTEKEWGELAQILEEKSKQITHNEAQLLLYKINQIAYKKKKTKEKIHYKELEKQRLIEALGLSDIKLKDHEVTEAIRREWDQTKAFWKDNENQYHGYIAYTKEKIAEDKTTKKQYEEKVQALQQEINKFEIKEEALAEDKKRLGQFYDFMALAFPENIAEDLNKMKEKIEIAIDKKTSEIKSSKIQLASIKEQINQLSYTLKRKQEEATLLKRKIEKQENHELTIAKRVTSQLLESYDGNLLNHQWFANKQKALELMEKNKEEMLEATQQRIWEKNLDRLLNKEAYFIPNKDILAIKSQIQQIGIHVETGSEHLNGLSEEEREDCLKKYPEFLYAVVIANEKDWGLIEKNINKDLFLNNMVPIYIRSKMRDDHKQAFKTLENRANTLVHQDHYINWKNTLSDAVEGLLKTELRLKTDLANVMELKQELKIISTSDTALILNQELKQHEDILVEIREEITDKEQEKLKVTSQLEMAQISLDDQNNQYHKLKEDLEEIKNYIEKVKLMDLEKITILNTINQIKILKEKIQERENNMDDYLSGQNKIKDSYNQWQLEIKNIIKDVKSVFGKAEYGYAPNGNYTNYHILVPDFSIKANKLMALVNEKKALGQSMAERNNQIAILETDLKYLNKDLERHLTGLQALSQEWNTYPDLDLPLDEIRMIIEQMIKKDETLKKIKEEVNSQLKTIEGRIKEMRRSLVGKKNQIFKDHDRYPIVLEIKDISREINIIERDIESNKRYLSACYESLQKNKDNQLKLQLNLSKIKAGYLLTLSKGKIDDILKEKIKRDPDTVVDDWLRKCENNKNQISRTTDEGERFRAKFIKNMGFKLEEDKLKDTIIRVIKEVEIMNFKNNLDSFRSMENNFQHELDKLSQDKEKAQDAMKQWTDRSAIHVMRMVEALKSMINSMVYMNDRGNAFPLVKLKGAERLPKQESEISYLLEEYFIQAISKVIEASKDVSKIDDKLLEDLMGDGVIFSKALQGRYPTLLVYKMSEKNEFRYARARDEYYTTWEAINKGEGISPEGSGGQSLSINTFVIMMIMSFKKKHIGNENPSTVLILDNPFGAASAKYMLDPIFEIADKLNFQLICFAAPEIIKVEISERFPIFWELRVEKGKIVHGGRVMRKSP